MANFSASGEEMLPLLAEFCEFIRDDYLACCVASVRNGSYDASDSSGWVALRRPVKMMEVYLPAVKNGPVEPAGGCISEHG